MKTRVRKPDGPLHWQPASFVQVEQAQMFVARDSEQCRKLLGDEKRVKGSFVKYAPTIPASERATLDTSAVRTEFLTAGAAACVVVPHVVSDSTAGQKRQKVTKVTAEQQLREWFETVKGPAKMIAGALEQAMKSVEEAGL